MIREVIKPVLIIHRNGGNVVRDSLIYLKKSHETKQRHWFEAVLWLEEGG